MSKRITITKEQAEQYAMQLTSGDDVVLKVSPRRTFILSTKTNEEIKLRALEARFEAQKAKIVGSMQPTE